MSGDVIFQSRLFVMAILWGGGLMLAYDGLRLIRMFFTHGRYVQALEEILFWLAASGVIYGLIYNYNSGAVRNYVVFGMAVGMVIYRWLLSALVISGACFILRPLRRICLIFKDFLTNIGKGLKNGAKRVKIKISTGLGKRRGKPSKKRKRRKRQGE